jgi:hypothetical protein
MFHIIKESKDCVLSFIDVKKPYKVANDIWVFDLSYNKEPFVFQTPECIIPYSYYMYDNKTFRLDVNMINNEFPQMLSDVNKNIIKRVSKYDNNLIGDKLYINYIKKCESVESNDYRLRLKNNHIDNVVVFDQTKNKIPVTTLQTFDKLICLFQLQRLIVQKDSYMFQCHLLQVKRLNTVILNTSLCLIETFHDVDHELNNDFQKYQKMYDLGIPQAAVRHKMILDGISEHDIQQYMSNMAITKPHKHTQQLVVPSPPPPPPFPLNQLLAHVDKPELPKLSFLNDIRNNTIKLNKPKSQTLSQQPSICNIMKSKYGYDAPSLTDILDARAKLKKIA